MTGNKVSRAVLFENFDSPFADGSKPTNQDFQDFGSSFAHKDDQPSTGVEIHAMISDEVIEPDGPGYMELDPGGLNRDITPSGTFLAGVKIYILNSADAAENIVFDPGALAAIIAQGQIGTFLYNGSTWRKIALGSF
jgi:hypothetical protein